jgi:hypothetical protein
MEHVSEHAGRRMQQRGIPFTAVDAAIGWGQTTRQQHGRTAYFLGERDARRAKKQGENLSQFVGTAVIVGRDGGLISALRIARPNRLKQKAK